MPPQSRSRISSIAVAIAAAIALAPVPPLGAQLLEVKAPAENPLTDEKALLGKFLFWEEQLSADDTVACGSCHRPAGGGADPRALGPFSIHPGSDGQFGTEDDVRGSVGAVRSSCDDDEVDPDPFAPLPQVTRRRAPSVIGAALAPELFWDGRAGGEFIDPVGKDLLIAAGGALENQALEPILSPVEMGCEGRTWEQVTDKLAAASPLLLATSIPEDMAAALESDPTYPDLFELAFGTPEITPARIAFAIASYERTLIPDQTPFDLYLAGDGSALTEAQNQGLGLFNSSCGTCHVSFETTDHAFHNIGVRPGAEDLGREEVTGEIGDRGKMKTPGLRNVKLRAPYFHTGGKTTLDDVLAFYNAGGDFDDNLDMLVFPFGFSDEDLADIKDFLENALTDPRVEAEEPPFDHPGLRPFFRRGDSDRDGEVAIADVLHVLGAIFLADGELLCADAADANDDGALGIVDPIYVLNFLYLAGPLPAAPTPLSFGPDPTFDALDCAF
ncbi:MAG: hypothetical protein L0Z55_09795 [Planctomycetes bacterium]|nr:hypothetical protein [Planctomycetota bacterium]